MLTASRERGVIGCREIDAQHPEDRCQDALGLTQRSVEDETERQGGFDGAIGILELPAPPADASRCPRGDRVGREPEGDVASPHEGSVVLGPVPDAIRCRVLRMHSRLHIEIMTRRRSRWSTCRPLLAHRAESAHQRRSRRHCTAAAWAAMARPTDRWGISARSRASSLGSGTPCRPPCGWRRSWPTGRASRSMAARTSWTPTAGNQCPRICPRCLGSWPRMSISPDWGCVRSARSAHTSRRVTTPVRPGRFRCSPDSYVLWRRPLGARHTMASFQSRPE